MKRFDLDTTAMILKPYLFYGFRMIMYYLPEYTIYLEKQKSLAGAVRQTFWGIGRQTYLSKGIMLPPHISRIATFQVSNSGGPGLHQIAGLGEAWVHSAPAADFLRELDQSSP